MFLGMNEKRSRGFCSPGHLAKRLGHRDNRTNISKKGMMRQPKDDHRQEATTPLGLEGRVGSPSNGRWNQCVCLEGAGTAEEKQPLARDAMRGRGVESLASPLLPAFHLVPNLLRGQWARRSGTETLGEEGGDRRREPRGKRLVERHQVSKCWLLLMDQG